MFLANACVLAASGGISLYSGRGLLLGISKFSEAQNPHPVFFFSGHMSPPVALDATQCMYMHAMSSQVAHEICIVAVGSHVLANRAAHQEAGQ